MSRLGTLGELCKYGFDSSGKEAYNVTSLKTNKHVLNTSVLEVSPSKERCAMCEFLGQLSSSYVVNLMIF